MHNEMMDTFSLTRLFDAAFLTAAFIFNALILDASAQSIAIAVGGSISGAIILAFLRRDTRVTEQFFKVASSAISGIVIGTAVNEYWTIEAPAFRLFVFFNSSLLALVFLRTLLALANDNATEVLRGILQRLFNLRVETEITKNRVKRVEKKVEQLEQKEGE